MVLTGSAEAPYAASGCGGAAPLGAQEAAMSEPSSSYLRIHDDPVFKGGVRQASAISTWACPRRSYRTSLHARFFTVAVPSL